VTLEFLSIDAARAENGFEPLGRSPLERTQRAAGARMEVRDGWRVAADYGSVEDEQRACAEAAGIAESSQLGKLELQGPPAALADVVAGATGGGGLAPGRALVAAGARWCPIHPGRVLVLCSPGMTAELRDELERAVAKLDRTSIVEVTTGLAAFTVIGPAAREVLARLTALDLRPSSLPEQGFAPGSVARVPAMVLREGGDRFLVLFGSAYAEYEWTALTDAGLALDGRLVGADALEQAVDVAGA
jgi:sarcosine oxidase, subunit gamma